MTRFRLRVKEVAEAKGVSASRLSHQTYLAFSTVRLIFKEPYQSVTLDTLQKIANALGVSIHDLIEEVPDEATEETEDKDSQDA